MKKEIESQKVKVKLFNLAWELGNNKNNTTETKLQKFVTRLLIKKLWNRDLARRCRNAYLASKKLS